MNEHGLHYAVRKSTVIRICKTAIKRDYRRSFKNDITAFGS